MPAEGSQNLGPAPTPGMTTSTWTYWVQAPLGGDWRDIVADALSDYPELELDFEAEDWARPSSAVVRVTGPLMDVCLWASVCELYEGPDGEQLIVLEREAPDA